jgi:hypothetical protein
MIFGLLYLLFGYIYLDLILIIRCYYTWKSFSFLYYNNTALHMCKRRRPSVYSTAFSGIVLSKKACFYPAFIAARPFRHQWCPGFFISASRHPLRLCSICTDLASVMWSKTALSCAAHKPLYSP